MACPIPTCWASALTRDDQAGCHFNPAIAQLAARTRRMSIGLLMSAGECSADDDCRPAAGQFPADLYAYALRCPGHNSHLAVEVEGCGAHVSAPFGQSLSLSLWT